MFLSPADSPDLPIDIYADPFEAPYIDTAGKPAQTPPGARNC